MIPTSATSAGIPNSTAVTACAGISHISSATAVNKGFSLIPRIISTHSPNQKNRSDNSAANSGSAMCQSSSRQHA